MGDESETKEHMSRTREDEWLFKKEVSLTYAIAWLINEIGVVPKELVGPKRKTPITEFTINREESFKASGQNRSSRSDISIRYSDGAGPKCTRKDCHCEGQQLVLIEAKAPGISFASSGSAKETQRSQIDRYLSALKECEATALVLLGEPSIGEPLQLSNLYKNWDTSKQQGRVHALTYRELYNRLSGKRNVGKRAAMVLEQLRNDYFAAFEGDGIVPAFWKICAQEPSEKRSRASIPLLSFDEDQWVRTFVFLARRKPEGLDSLAKSFKLKQLDWKDVSLHPIIEGKGAAGRKSKPDLQLGDLFVEAKVRAPISSAQIRKYREIVGEKCIKSLTPSPSDCLTLESLESKQGKEEFVVHNISMAEALTSLSEKTNGHGKAQLNNLLVDEMFLVLERVKYFSQTVEQFANVIETTGVRDFKVYFADSTGSSRPLLVAALDRRIMFQKNPTLFELMIEVQKAGSRTNLSPSEYGAAPFEVTIMLKRDYLAVGDGLTSTDWAAVKFWTGKLNRRLKETLLAHSPSIPFAIGSWAGRKEHAISDPDFFKTDDGFGFGYGYGAAQYGWSGHGLRIVIPSCCDSLERWLPVLLQDVSDEVDALAKTKEVMVMPEWLQKAREDEMEALSNLWVVEKGGNKAAPRGWHKAQTGKEDWYRYMIEWLGLGTQQLAHELGLETKTVKGHLKSLGMADVERGKMYKAGVPSREAYRAQRNKIAA